MKFTSSIISFLFAGIFLLACQSSNSDADIQQHINDLFTKDMAGAALNATVDSGVATISGQCKGKGCTAEITGKVKKIKGVRDVQTHIIEQP